MSEENDQTDLEILQEIMEDYDCTPEDTLADLIERINDAELEA